MSYFLCIYSISNLIFCFQLYDTDMVMTLGVMAAHSILICDIDTLRWPGMGLGFQKCFAQYPTLA